jgi:hypothetical protein
MRWTVLFLVAYFLAKSSGEVATGIAVVASRRYIGPRLLTPHHHLSPRIIRSAGDWLL